MKTIFDPVTEKWRDIARNLPPAILDGGSRQVMIIDMGHGGIDNEGVYTTAPNKMFKHKDFTFLEGEWNRAVGWTLAEQLEQVARSYVILNTGYKDIPLQARITQLTKMKQYLENHGRSFYVHSIHGNAFGLESVNGVEVYTSPGNTKADPLAEVYFKELEKLGWRMRPGYGDGDSDKEARFTMLTGPEAMGIPSILTETGFYTNEIQAREMCMLDTIDQIAELMLQADVQIDYLNLLS